jgi:putative ABC transport system substrate-binding protein
MRRRDFLGAMAGLASLPAHAQEGTGTRRIGVVMAYSEVDATGRALVAVFTQALQDLGWTAGVNVHIDVHWASSDADNFYSIAQRLSGEHPDAVLAVSNLAVTALRASATNVPIVFTQVSDPIGRGFVAALAQPGGNITGFGSFETSMGGKWLEILKQMAPGLTQVALVFNPATSPHIDKGYYLIAAEEAGRQLGIRTVDARIHEVGEAEQKIAAFAGAPNGGLIVLPDTFTIDHAGFLASLASQHSLPAIYPYPLFVQNGGLVSYGVDVKDQYTGAATYIDRILKGAKPAELPVRFPNRFQLMINLKTAKALGLEVPATLLVTAAEVIR